MLETNTLMFDIILFKKLFKKAISSWRRLIPTKDWPTCSERLLVDSSHFIAKV